MLNTTDHQRLMTLLYKPLFGLILGTVIISCSKDSITAADGVIVQSATETKPVGREFASDFKVEPERPLHWSFATSNSITAEHGYLMARQIPLQYEANKGNWGLGSMLIGNRTESWHGMMLRLPQLEQKKAFKVSLWVKLDNVEFPSDAKLILTRVISGKTNTIELANSKILPGDWQKLEGTFIALSDKIDNVSTIHVDMNVVSANYHIDDITLSYAEYDAEKLLASAVQNNSILRNGDVELGLDYWGSQGGAINLSTKYAHSGKHSIFISERTQTWNAPTMELHGLKADLQYRIGVFTRLKDGSHPAEMQLTLKTVVSGQSTFIPLHNTRATDAGWVEVYGVFSGASVQNADSVVAYLEALDSTASYYVDTLTVEAIE